MKYPVAFLPPETGVAGTQWCISVPNTGINTVGDTLEEGLEMLKEAVALWKEGMPPASILAPQSIDAILQDDFWDEWMIRRIELDLEPFSPALAETPTHDEV